MSRNPMSRYLTSGTVRMPLRDNGLRHSRPALAVKSASAYRFNLPDTYSADLSRRRKVKCDEGKPTCNRCKAVGLECHFPLSLTASSRPTANNTTTTVSTSTNKTNKLGRLNSYTEIIRDTPAGGAIATAIPGGDTRILVVPDYVTTVFKDQTSWDMFSTFLFTNEQGTSLPHNTLAAITPQIAHTNPAIREMCCAVGAAVGAFTAPHVVGEAAEKAQQLSLMYYNRTIRAVRASGTGLQSLLQVAHVAVIFMVYDMMRGDMKAATLHFDHASRLLITYFGKRCEQEQVSLSDLKLDALESAMFDMFQRLSTYSWPLELGINGDDRPDFKGGKRCWGRHRYEIYNMPTSFRDLDEALRWWDVTQHHISHHLFDDEAVIDPESKAAWEKAFTVLDNWHRAFVLLYRSTEDYQYDYPHRYVTACIFEALYTECLAGLHLQLNADTKVLPDARPIWREIIRTTRRMQQELKETIDWNVMDNMVVKALVIVLFKCRDAEVRKDVKVVLEEAVAWYGQSCLAAVMLGIMTMKANQIPVQMKNIERAVGWHLTSIGCGPGVISIG
ncbi:uncharacterized protein B0J16DRAFT_349091 [Fusarium flagelliforme]|uniref:uncharacterized protein n=1 Tax=Fusarium flagelliforme TaxID=2675880 RepID=UPI001E8E9CC7|nr:uncharacterized protein B0J16DRAFT_349091 [Fusarium flagelliforme]KAH7174736.1 hypothetical protein B0J16DRAFT_349091 [Fusarium flagelliforme]